MAWTFDQLINIHQRTIHYSSTIKQLMWASSAIRRRRLVRRWHPCRMPAALQLLPATFLVLSSLLTITDACSSRSTPKPRPPAPTARPNVTFHTYACPPAYATWYCLNGATCFTVKIAESLLYNCECANGYMGQRCEFKDLEGSYLPSRQRVASIASGATIAVFLVVIVCASLYIRYQRRLKLSRATSCVDGGGDLERRDPFSRPRPTALPLSRVTTESSSECATTSLYMHHHVGEGRGEPPIPHPAAPP
ncbi:protransforming growth factor alpha-like isoform X1 [Nilaparvata lugens]|uniref:protransforming growth factor alpha-like isoform X1 n=1 Tax=Nilaparvata lugens TaxID=108931 RepID=UPI00193D8372|nr:protransforming growth factor alpha-like isoform X1 [Nilaparvata lugens]